LKLLDFLSVSCYNKHIENKVVLKNFMGSNYEKLFEKDYAKLTSKVSNLEKLIKTLTGTISNLNTTINTLNATIGKKDDLIEKLILENNRLKNNNDKDSTNSGKPSSTDGLKKKRKIANLRPKTDKKKGGQVGHKGTTADKATVDKLLKRDDVAHVVIDINKTDKNSNELYITRYVQDIEVRTVLKEFRYYPDESGKYRIPKEQSNILTYGNGVKSISMLLVHKLPASMDSVVGFLSNITNNIFDITKSTLANWTKAFSNGLDPFIEEILKNLLNSTYIHTDESPINVDGTLYQLHNYSNDKYTLQYVHKSKSKEAMQELGFLNNFLGTLIHDHNTVQYNFGTGHAECNVHILRYLQGVNDFTKHKWAKNMSDLLKEILHQKHLLIEKGKKAFLSSKIKEYSDRYDDILKKGKEEYLSDVLTNAYKDEERRLRTRLEKYKKNHLLFMNDFNIPFSNNRAEADIRPAKRKLNVGIFRSVDGAEYFLQIRSFISTFLKNELNIFTGIKDIFAGKKISLLEG